MCGIFGVIKGKGRPLDLRLVLGQLATIAHRGPDGYGLMLANSATGRAATAHNGVPEEVRDFDVVLGHRRLSILDLSPAAAQPMTDGDLSVTFNGEIYNFAELRSELETRGHVFRTDHSDTEVLLHAFREWREGCLLRLRGMFAFAILDLERRRLFLARDRLGKKPLYFAAGPDRFTFASELKAIAADPGGTCRLDAVAMAQYLMYNYVPAPRTIYQGLQKLPAAHCAWVEIARPERVHMQEYWTLRWEPDDVPPLEMEDWIARFDTAFMEAVRLRMISDVPLGALLSGGIDSTLVVRAMSQLSPRPVKTFSVGLAGDEKSELPWARRVAERYGTEHYEDIVTPDAVALLPTLAAVYDEPFGDASALPTYSVFGMASGHVTVVLSGDGGDELFAGYNQYDLVRTLDRVDWLPPAVRRLVLGTGARLWPENFQGKGRLTLLGQAPRERYRELRAKPAALRFLSRDLRRAVADDPALDAHFDVAWARAPHDAISRLQYVDMKTYLPEDILVKVDRASMAHSLEARCPLLDHHVVELAARMPLRFKYRPGEKKLLLKRILSADLGPDFVARRKTGFGPPRDVWLRGQLATHVRERLVDVNGSLPEEIDRSTVAELVRSYHRGNRDLSRYVWNLLMLSAWTETHRTLVHA
jgi:asparagine synthase (glutamine-hydrolysing)